MKRFSLLALLAAVVLAGCTGGSSQPDAKASAEGGMKVALLTPGSVSDSGWNALAFDGLQAIKSDLGATVNNQEATGTNINDALRTYAQQDYKLVIGHGFEYNAPANEVAKDFPNTVFVTTSGDKTAANVGVIRFNLEQGFYLAGMMAGLMSKTGKVATVGFDVPSIASTFKAFEAGAKAARPDVVIIRKQLPLEGTDVAAAKQATLAAISEGADFVIHQANQTAQGVFNAAKEKGIYAFGANADQNNNDSGVVIASATIVAKPAFLKIAQEVKNGNFKGGVTFIGMDQGAIDFVVNPNLKDKVPADVITKIEAARADIKSGKLAVPYDKF